MLARGLGLEHGRGGQGGQLGGRGPGQRLPVLRARGDGGRAYAPEWVVGMHIDTPSWRGEGGRGGAWGSSRALSIAAVCECVSGTVIGSPAGSGWRLLGHEEPAGGQEEQDDHTAREGVCEGRGHRGGQVGGESTGVRTRTGEEEEGAARDGT